VSSILTDASHKAVDISIPEVGIFKQSRRCVLVVHALVHID
jgi:hypothetical protein